MAAIVDKSPWTKEQIGALSNSQLSHLNYDEMVEIVLLSGVPLRNVEGVYTMESDALVRLVHWARQYCRGHANMAERSKV
jgi:hypothetical protein